MRCWFGINCGLNFVVKQFQLIRVLRVELTVLQSINNISLIALPFWISLTNADLIPCINLIRQISISATQSDLIFLNHDCFLLNGFPIDLNDVPFSLDTLGQGGVLEQCEGDLSWRVYQNQSVINNWKVKDWLHFSSDFVDFVVYALTGVVAEFYENWNYWILSVCEYVKHCTACCYDDLIADGVLLCDLLWKCEGDICCLQILCPFQMLWWQVPLAYQAKTRDARHQTKYNSAEEKVRFHYRVLLFFIEIVPIIYKLVNRKVFSAPLFFGLKLKSWRKL